MLAFYLVWHRFTMWLHVRKYGKIGPLKSLTPLPNWTPPPLDPKPGDRWRSVDGLLYELDEKEMWNELPGQEIPPSGEE
jgi:hypothetical protein